jgi:hypothetical protein
MSAGVILAKLERVRRTGHERWLARCPAHEDGSPSLSVRELEDGRTLVHCFASCSVGDVLAAIGLNYDSLFPERHPSDHRRPPERRPIHAEDVMRAVAFEAQAAAIIAARVAYGYAVDWAEFERLLTAAARLANAAIAAGADDDDRNARSRIKARREHLAKAA